MNPSVFGGSAALLLVLTWLITRRRPVVLLRSTDASAVAALNRAQITRLRDQAGAEIPGAAGSRPPEISLPLPAAGDRRGRARLLRELGQRLQGSTAERRAAITTAASWGDRAALPLLRRGLRDADPQVVLTAADGMALFRGRSAAQAVRQTPERVPLPRNGAPQWRG
jgi:hypothetical protein